MTVSHSIVDARAALKDHFGYPAFRPGQEAAVESVLAGKDTLVVLPTGGGKSLCYQVPALMLPKLTVVISPLISLMKDQVDALAKRGLPATFVNSTLSSSQISDRISRALRGDVKLLYVAPERFDVGVTAERLRDAGVSLLAVDEAHCISEWGHDFRPSYLRIAQVREKLGWPPTVALTATATPHVRTDIVAQLKLDAPTTIITGFDRVNLTYAVVPTKTESDKDDALVHLLREHDGLAVIYASTRKAVERISMLLERARISAAAYHAGLDDERRHEVQDAFMSEKVRAIVATNAFGMGIDKPNVRLVLHYAMPGTLEAYYQEAGRAGRDGLHSDVFLLHAFPDRFTHEFFIKGSYPERPVIEQTYEALRLSANAQGFVAAEPEEIARAVKPALNAREVESAVKILSRSGAVTVSNGERERVMVRLLATPERIKRELTGESNSELGLLRAMWRGVGSSLSTGAVIDLGGLPPGLGRAAACTPLLDSLQSKQFLTWERLGAGLYLTDKKAPLSRFEIDWATLDRRGRNETAKLQAVQQYAYTKECRRGFVLRYFGDPAARRACNGCDTCLGVAAPRLTRGESQLRERARKKTATEKPAVRRRPAAVRDNGDDDSPLGDDGQRLLANLKAVRTAIAREEHVPPYIVFTDRTLAEFALRRPRSLRALQDVRGVGPVKVERYGERFLDVISKADDIEAA